MPQRNGAMELMMDDASLVRFDCMHCSKRLKALPQQAGKRIKCPKCGHALTVPAAAAPLPAAPPPAASNAPVPLPYSPPSREEKELFVKQFDGLKAACVQYMEARRSVLAAAAEQARQALERRAPSNDYLSDLRTLSQDMGDTQRRQQALQQIGTVDLVLRKGLIALGPKFLPAYVTGIEAEFQASEHGNFRFLCALINIVEELGNSARDAVPILLKVLHSNCGLPGQFAAGALGAIGSPEALAALTQIRDETKTIKEPHLVFFSKTRTEPVHPEALRKAAAEALAKLNRGS